MKRPYLMLSLVAALALLTPAVASAESGDQESGFGVAVNSAFNGEVLPLRLIVTGLYYQGVNQFEIGVGLHPFIRQEQTIISGDFNYKLFPNGTSDLLNMYLLANLSYIYSTRVTFFPTTYNYLFLHGGYGVELSGDNSFYMDSNISFGGFTYSKTSENPATSFLDAERFFEDFGTSISIQVNVGYRF